MRLHRRDVPAPLRHPSPSRRTAPPGMPPLAAQVVAPQPALGLFARVVAPLPALGPAAQVVALLLALGLAACGSDPSDDPSPSGLGQADLVRTRVAALFEEGEFGLALEQLQTLLEDELSARDLAAAAMLHWERSQEANADPVTELEQAWARSQEALAADPDDLYALYVSGNLLLDYRFEDEAAAETFARVLERAPDDAPTLLRLGEAEERLGRREDAERRYRAVLDMGVEATGSLYVTATYKLGLQLSRRGDAEGMEEGRALLAERDVLDAAGIKAARPQDIARGNLGRPFIPPVSPLPPGPPSDRPAPVYVEGPEVGLTQFDMVRVGDIDGDQRLDLVGLRHAATAPEGNISTALQTAPGLFEIFETGRPVGAQQAELADLDPTPVTEAGEPVRDVPRLAELVVVEDGRVVLLEWSGAGWTERPDALPEVRDVVAVEPVDLDHEGDLDLALATAAGTRLLRQDGAGQWTEDTPPLFATAPGAREVLAEDVDGDGDVDLAVLAEDGLTIFSSLRGWRFERDPAAWGLPALDGSDLIAGDLDHDGRVDLSLATADGERTWLAFDGARFEAPVSEPLDAIIVQDVDLDLDGRTDRVTWGRKGIEARMGPVARRTGPIPPRSLGLDAARLVGAAPVLGVGAPQLILLTPEGVRLALPDNDASVFGLDLWGLKDNADGRGAIVEVLTSDSYQRHFWRGGPAVFGIGQAAVADVVRITWPNGVVQHPQLEDDLPGVPHGALVEVEQVNRLVGSCPFLYTFDGDEWHFITDVLGATPLGLPMGPDAPVPFDHEEYVKIPGHLLAPDEEGRLTLALTEELREVTYLDRVRLHAIDHEAGVEVEPHEGFVFPPFPPHHVHTFREVLAPASAVANSSTPGPSGGREGGADPGPGPASGEVTHGETPSRGGPLLDEDVTAALTAVDDLVARPFRVLPEQFRGLTEPWTLDLHFGADDDERRAIAAAPRLRLALTGWLQWGDASVNMAAARHPDHAYEVPRLWVPEGQGWREVDPPIGFPAGKTKTLVVDVTDLLVRDDPRLRLTTTLELSWDAIRLVIDDDDAPYADHPLEPATADLAWRGFSRMQTDADGLELFDWDTLAEEIPWTQHPGLYTRYGDVLPLLGEVDDRTVIFGAGDALTLSFDGRDLPPLPEGHVRDWLLYVDGWAKDGDPNTLAAQQVEPLPFHGMSRYPPAPGEAFPDSEEHRAWQREWNTRPAAELIPELLTRDRADRTTWVRHALGDALGGG